MRENIDYIKVPNLEHYQIQLIILLLEIKFL